MPGSFSLLWLGMKKIGLTGGIGSGKSTVASLFADHGFPIVDADSIARDVVKPGQPALRELVEAFGEDILIDGVLNRAELARRAFASSEQTQVLNSITHPRIKEESWRQFAVAETAGATAVVFDMPLLVDLGWHRDMDLVVVVDAPAELRIQRLVSVRGLEEQDARQRVAAQISDTARQAAADVIIDNSGSLEDLEQRVKNLIAQL